MRSFFLKIICFFSGGFALFFLAYTPAVFAVSISPLTFEINVNPGDTITNFITISNTDNSSVGIQMQSEDFGAVGEQGQVNIREDLPAALSAKKWLTFEPATFTLNSHESKDVKFMLHVPPDAEPGGKYTSILASIGGGGDGAVSIAQKVASLLLIRVAGAVRESMFIKSFTAPSFSEYGPIKFDLRIENDGSVHLKPAGYISIKNILGREVEKIDLPQQRVLPQTIRDIQFEWNKKWDFGKYTADLLGVYGSSNEQLSESISFWVIPWKITAGILFAIILLLVIFLKLRRRFFLAMRILIKGV